jgi:hypothetical protein
VSRGGQGNHGTLARRVTIPPCLETHTLTAAASAELSAESPRRPGPAGLGHQPPGRRRAAHRLLPRNALSLTAVFDGPGVTHDDGGGVVAWGVRAEDVIAVPDMLDGARVRHWVGGGWGVAALTGRALGRRASGPLRRGRSWPAAGPGWRALRLSAFRVHHGVDRRPHRPLPIRGAAAAVSDRVRASPARHP